MYEIIWVIHGPLPGHGISVQCPEWASKSDQRGVVRRVKVRPEDYPPGAEEGRVSKRAYLLERSKVPVVPSPSPDR